LPPGTSSVPLDRPPVVVRQAVEADLAAWQQFVDDQPEAGPLHHAGWYRVLREAYRVQPAFFMATDVSGAIRGIVPTYRSNSVFTGRHYTTLEGGILAGDAEAQRALHATIKDLRNEPGVAYSQLRGGAVDERDAIQIATVHTVLRTGEGRDARWAAIKGKTRWGIRQAEKQELHVGRNDDLSGLDAFYDLYAAHMRDLGTPVFGSGTLRAMRRHIGPERLRLYLLTHRGKCIGGMVCVVHGRRWTDLYAIVRRSRETEFANYLLYWHVIREAADLGVEEFDLGRSAPQSTVHLFKRKWGGRDVEIPYIFFAGPRARSRSFGLVGETREMGLRQRVWSKLPLTLCNIVGPLVRADLPFL
jgi:hypothetical protein